MTPLTLASFFSGAGGMDVGFKQAGYNILWANEYDKDIWDTYRANHKDTVLDTRSIFDIPSNDIPDTDGIIGGPPCQSWSAAGKNLGADDMRGKTFFEYIRILNDKNPKFFVIENVEGITRKTHAHAFEQIMNDLRKCGSGYMIHWKLLTASDYEVPQDRKRVFIIGIRSDLDGSSYTFPEPSTRRLYLKEVIYDLVSYAIPSRTSVTSNPNCYLDAGWSSNFMSRNRVRGWNEFAFTVPASSRHVTIHPQAPKMVKLDDKDRFGFVLGQEHLYRRFTINELSRIQTFPDNYFVFRNINTGYKMVGNAVPCNLATAVAKSILNIIKPKPRSKITVDVRKRSERFTDRL